MVAMPPVNSTMQAVLEDGVELSALETFKMKQEISTRAVASPHILTYPVGSASVAELRHTTDRLVFWMKKLA